MTIATPAATLATANREDLDVIASTIPARVAEALNAEFVTAFVGRQECDFRLKLTVDLTLQHMDTHRALPIERSAPACKTASCPVRP